MLLVIMVLEKHVGEARVYDVQPCFDWVLGGVRVSSGYGLFLVAWGHVVDLWLICCSSSLSCCFYSDAFLILQLLIACGSCGGSDGVMEPRSALELYTVWVWPSHRYH